MMHKAYGHLHSPLSTLTNIAGPSRRFLKPSGLQALHALSLDEGSTLQKFKNGAEFSPIIVVGSHTSNNAGSYATLFAVDSWEGHNYLPKKGGCFRGKEAPPSDPGTSLQM